jgi:hypothetical protein
MDRALEMDPNNCGLIDTKDMVLSKFGNYIGSMKCYDKALRNTSL